MNMPETVRLFVALEMPSEVKVALHELAERLPRALGERAAKSVRWTDPDGVHLTLKFLGSVNVAQVEPLSTRLGKALVDCAPVPLETGALGVFPKAVRPRVLWWGLEGDREGLNLLQGLTEDICERAGFPPEDRDFAPHLTLGRVREGLQEFERAKLGRDYLIQEAPRLEWSAAEVSLMRSVFTSAGAVYSRVAVFPLLGS